jgi:hypothetical protein
MHGETGYIRFPNPTTAEIILAQPSGNDKFFVPKMVGISTVEEGVAEEGKLQMKSSKIERSSTAKHPWYSI